MFTCQCSRSSDNPKELHARRTGSPNTDNVDDDSDETTHKSRKYSLRSSSSKTKTVYQKKQKTYPLDLHCDDVNDEPDATSGKFIYHLVIFIFKIGGLFHQNSLTNLYVQMLQLLCFFYRSIIELTL